MARPIKEGLDYFSFDIDFFHDQKVEFVSAKYGIEGEIITIKLLCKIYREGYYLNWGDDECLLFSKKVGENISSNLVKNVVDELLKRDFFNQNLYIKFSVLTSKGIQKRYFEAIKRRKDFAFCSDYCLLNGVNVYNNPINVYINPQNVDINKQSKVKETKVNEIKEEKSVIFLKTWKDFKEMRKKKNKPMTLKAEELIINELNKLSNNEVGQVAILNQSIMNSWQGVYALKDKPVDDEVQPKWEKKEVPKLTLEQVAKNKARMKELANVMKGIGIMPETAEGGKHEI